MRSTGEVRPSGALGIEVVRGNGEVEHRPVTYLRSSRYTHERPGEPSLRQIIEHGCPQAGLHPFVNTWRRANLPNLWRGARRVLLHRQLAKAKLGVAHAYGALWLSLDSEEHGHLNLGLASLRVVTTNGVGFIVDAFQNLVEPENMKYHGFGSGSTAEASSDAALVTEFTTEYATDNVRPTGSLGEGASGNIFRTIATFAPDANAAVTEHGVFSQAATGGGVLFDRSKFSVINLVGSADSIVSTYDATFAAGG